MFEVGEIYKIDQRFLMPPHKNSFAAVICTLNEYKELVAVKDSLNRETIVIVREPIIVTYLQKLKRDYALYFGFLYDNKLIGIHEEWFLRQHGLKAEKL